MKSVLSSSLLALGLVASLSAAPISFDFKDPKGVNAIQFSLDSVLEPIAGTAGGVTGTVSFDPAAPGATTGKIVVATKSLVVPNSTMNEHILGKDWLDAATNPEISFELVKLEGVSTSGNVTSATATGKFTLKGVTKQIKVPVKLTYLAGAFGKRINKPEVKGDLLVVRGEFTIARADYGIQPGKNEDKVNPEIKLSLAIVGSAPQG
jgi:polyisoprenoid-binding protein YceI